MHDKNVSTKSGRMRFGKLAGTSALALVMGLAVIGTSLPALSENATPNPLYSFADIVAATKPAVVTVLTEISAQPEMAQGEMGPQDSPEEFFRRFFGDNGPFQGFPQMPPGMENGPGQGPQQPGMALGSGFIIAKDGTVVTNNHVIENASKITIKFDDGTELPAKLVGADAKNDIAVLKIEADKEFPTVAWGDSDALRLGDPVLAIGDPFGIGTTVTSGIVSARGRDLHNGPYDDFIQIDAAINHGNSGGPLFDENGRVVGINTAIYSPNGGNVGVGFAIPSAQAEKVVEQIIKGGSIEHGYIGVRIQPVDKEIAGAIGLADAKGALVSLVEADSPAAKGGIKTGDVIISVNGNAVDSPKALSRAIADLAPGDKATVDVMRDNKSTTLEIAVGRMDGEGMSVAAIPEGHGDNTVASLGITVGALDPSVAQNLGLPDGTEGLLVTDVAPDGPAAGKGLQRGDVIEGVNQMPITSVEAFDAALKAAKDAKRDAVLLLVDRGGQKSFVAIPLAKG